MEAAYTKKDAVIILDVSEVRLIMRALDLLRYSDENLNGSQLVNLAGLSVEWRAMLQDMASPKKDRISNDPDRDYLITKVFNALEMEANT